MKEQVVVTATGKLIGTPELHGGAHVTPVLEFTMCCDPGNRDSSGLRSEESGHLELITCTLSGPEAATYCVFLREGSAVTVTGEGRIEYLKTGDNELSPRICLNVRNLGIHPTS